MPYFTLSGISLAGAVIAFLYARTHGGNDGTVVIADHVLTGSTLYGISGLLVVAAALFILAAIMRTVRRVATLIAIVVIGTSGGIGVLSPQSLTDYQLDHACKVVGDDCKSVSQLGEVLPGR